MIKPFKFFNGDCQPTLEPTRVPLLENEQIVSYWDDGGNRDMLYVKVIAWVRGTHAFSDEWIQREYEGTMEEFFTNRLGIPVILSIEAMVNNGVTFYEDDRIYMDQISFDFPVRIIYYEII
jgi:hypothetical protein